jgi:hypothetical protein
MAHYFIMKNLLTLSLAISRTYCSPTQIAIKNPLTLHLPFLKLIVNNPKLWLKFVMDRFFNCKIYLYSSQIWTYDSLMKVLLFIYLCKVVALCASKWTNFQLKTQPKCISLLTIINSQLRISFISHKPPKKENLKNTHHE